MKKPFLIACSIALSISSAFCGNWVNQSLLNPKISALIITNNTGGFTGVTNLNFVWQNAIQGVATGVGQIATNVNQVMFTNNAGQLVILTNGVLPTTVNLPGASIIYETTTTNGVYSTMNPFQDALFNSDLNSSQQQFLVGPAAGSSNIVQQTYVLGLLSVVLLPNQFYANAVGTGTMTNNVTMILEGVPFGPVMPQVSPVLGSWPTLGSQDLISGSQTTITFTNIPQLGVGTAGNLATPYVYQRPIMNTNFPGMRGFRVRSINCGGTGVSTNQLSIMGILFSDWAP